ncbi:MAG TPA: ester cyclase [Pyrinomonadaceae bacterium]|jgi:steroid delta-isomerase-like uncharacterized protein|nr:ester cyclase [Pyrinomonadaceae bacterium]
MSSHNEALVKRWFEEVWNQGRADAVDEMLAEDGIVHGLSDESGQPLQGPEAFKTFHGAFRGAFPDINVIVEDTISEGDKLAVRCTVRGKHTGAGLGFDATHADMDITGMAIVRIKDGKIVEAWNNFDFMTMHRQLGTI